MLREIEDVFPREQNGAGYVAPADTVRSESEPSRKGAQKFKHSQEVGGKRDPMGMAAYKHVDEERGNRQGISTAHCDTWTIGEVTALFEKSLSNFEIHQEDGQEKRERNNQEDQNLYVLRMQRGEKLLKSERQMGNSVGELSEVG